VLDRRIEETRLRVREGSALARDTSLLVAERLRVDEQLDAIETRHRVARAQLQALTGRDVSADVTVPAVLTLDRLGAPAALTAATPRTRPEFARFEATRARLAREVRASAVDGRPRVSAFLQAGVGRPGLNQLRPDADAFYLGGVRVSWRPLAHRDASRNAEILRLQQRITDLEEQAFADQLGRAVLAEVAEIERLDALAARDSALIANRADIERVARLELDEGLITTAQWITAQADLADARIAARRHEVERAYAWARLHTTLALPLP
jgi:outer membrane protein TolC